MSEEPAGAGSWVDEARAALMNGWRERLRSAMSFTPRELVAIAVVALVIVLGAGIAFVRALPRGGAAAAPLPVALESSPSPSPELVVYVTGAVAHPGVYDFAAGSRIVDAIRVAGGLTPGADASTLNLAEPLTDGERVYVPRRGETPPPVQSGGGGPAGGGSGSGGSGGAAKVNVNTATIAELDSLPGVGPVLAQRIVDYRTQHGPFRDVRDLMKVEGIGQKKFDSLKDFVTV